MLQAAATDASIYARFSSDDLAVFEITSNLSMVLAFQETYGMRFVGLADPGNIVYQDYRVPDPEAPYPQDIVIDPDGIVRYWSWEYDPREVLAVIERYASAACEPCDDPPILASRLVLEAARPSIFTTATRVSFRVFRPTDMQLHVLDASGRVVRTLFEGRADAGARTIRWDGRNRDGEPVASGVYFIRLAADDDREIRPVVLVR